MLEVFFFQAEDGIRDLVRSRGLGDVYKRQGIHIRSLAEGVVAQDALGDEPELPVEMDRRSIVAVSYTHLTLPTSDLV